MLCDHSFSLVVAVFVIVEISWSCWRSCLSVLSSSVWTIIIIIIINLFNLCNMFNQTNSSVENICLTSKENYAFKKTIWRLLDSLIMYHDKAVNAYTATGNIHHLPYTDIVAQDQPSHQFRYDMRATLSVHKSM